MWKMSADIFDLVFNFRIERSRSIVPTVLEAVALLKKGLNLNVGRIYELLFTTSNLRLVHIVCHDKGAHSSATCDPKELIVSVQQSPKRSKSDDLDDESKKLISSAASWRLAEFWILLHLCSKFLFTILEILSKFARLSPGWVYLLRFFSAGKSFPLDTDGCSSHDGFEFVRLLHIYFPYLSRFYA